MKFKANTPALAGRTATAICAEFLFAAAATGAAHAATFTVMNTNDSGIGSLRQAIIQSNAAGGSNTITFSVSGTITPSTALPTFTSQVTFDINGQSPVINGRINGGAITVMVSDSAATPGTLTFSRANTYTDGTTISSGTLSISQLGFFNPGYTSSGVGIGTVTLQGGGLRAAASGYLANDFVFGANATSTISAAAAQTLVLGGNPNISGNLGSITINSGAVLQFGTATDTGTVVIGSVAGLAPTVVPYSVVVAGGTLQDFQDELSLVTGYAQSTTVNSGATLDFNNSVQQIVTNLQGAGKVTTGSNSGTTLQIGLSNVTSTFSGVITGGGSISLFGSGGNTLILSGTNTYAGGTFICSCVTLQLGNGGTTGSILGDVSNDGTLAFNRSDTYTFAGTISGIGGLTQMGPGTTILTAATNSYFGPTTINGGTLEVDGGLPSSSVAVNSGGTLSGNGTIGLDSTINAGGTLAPGTAASIGTLTMNGPLTFQPGSFYNVRITPASNDFTQVNNTVTINGGTVNVLAGAGVYQPSTRYTILSATGGVNGTFSGVTSNLAFLTPSLSYDPNGDNVYLTMIASNTNFRSVASTSNQSSVAGGLTFAGLVNPSAPLITAFENLTSAQAQAALDALSGEGIAAADTTALRMNQLFGGAMSDQVSLWLGGGSNPNAVVLNEPSPGALGYAPTTKMKTPIVVHDPNLPPVRTWSAWASGFGADENVRGNSGLGTASQSAEVYGGAMGVDYQINPALLIGVAAAGSNGEFSVPGRTTYGSVTGGHIGAYCVATFGAFYGASSTSLSFFHNSETRVLSGFGGLGAETDHGGYDSHALRSRLEIGRRFFDVYGATITPFTALEIADLRSNGFSETPLTGAGIFALNAQGRDTVSVPAYLGLRFEQVLDLGSGMTLKPVLSLAYGHDFAPERMLTNTLLTLNSASFEIDGARVARDFAQTKAGFEVAFAPGALAFVNFEGAFAARDQLYGGKGGVKLVW